MEVEGGMAGNDNAVSIVPGLLGSSVSLALRLLQVLLSIAIVIGVAGVPDAFTLTFYYILFSTTIVQLFWSICMAGFDVYGLFNKLNVWDRKIILLSLFGDMIINHLSFSGTFGAGIVTISMGYELHTLLKHWLCNMPCPSLLSQVLGRFAWKPIVSSCLIICPEATFLAQHLALLSMIFFSSLVIVILVLL